MDIGGILASSPLFRGMAPGTIARLTRTARLQSYERGCIIFTEGQAANAIGVVAGGTIKLYRISVGGTETIVRIFSRTESFAQISDWATGLKSG